jgi:hypothetical protein
MSVRISPASRFTGCLLFLVGGIIIGATFTYLVASQWRRLHGVAQAPSPQPVVYSVYVLIEVNSMQLPAPQVEAVWLIRVPDNHARLELIGLPPEQFRDQFDRATGVPETLLRPYAPETALGTIVYDRQAVAQFVDTMGGVTLMGQAANGTDLLAFVDGADPAKPGDRLIRQGAVMQAVVLQAVRCGETLNALDMLRSPSLALIDQADLSTLLSWYYPLRDKPVRVLLQVDS